MLRVPTIRRITLEVCPVERCDPPLAFLLRQLLLPANERSLPAYEIQSSPCKSIQAAHKFVSGPEKLLIWIEGNRRNWSCRSMGSRWRQSYSSDLSSALAQISCSGHCLRSRTSCQSASSIVMPRPCYRQDCPFTMRRGGRMNTEPRMDAVCMLKEWFA